MQTLVTLLLAVLAFAQVVVLRKKWERFLRKDAVCARFTQNWPTVVKTMAWLVKQCDKIGARYVRDLLGLDSNLGHLAAVCYRRE